VVLAGGPLRPTPAMLLTRSRLVIRIGDLIGLPVLLDLGGG
jgi:hypothetical protein